MYGRLQRSGAGHFRGSRDLAQADTGDGAGSSREASMIFGQASAAHGRGGSNSLLWIGRDAGLVSRVIGCRRESGLDVSIETRSASSSAQ